MIEENKMEEVKIEHGVERKLIRKHKFPWEKMEIGDSFICSTGSKDNPWSKVYWANKRFAPKKFLGGMDKDGNKRIWRVE
jgi:hypothetical protein